MKEMRNHGWITLADTTHCWKCGKAIMTGDRAFFIPSTGKFYCNRDECGGSKSDGLDEDTANERMI